MKTSLLFTTKDGKQFTEVKALYKHLDLLESVAVNRLSELLANKNATAIKECLSDSDNMKLIVSLNDTITYTKLCSEMARDSFLGSYSETMYDAGGTH